LREAVAAGTIRFDMCTFVHALVTRPIRGGVQTVKTSAKGKTVCRGLRINQLLIGRIERAATDGGFSSPTAFMRAAIERELAGRESGVDASEERIAASLDRLAREIRGVKLGQQALFAFVDSLVKTLLTCVAEPPRDAHDQAVARGKVRYDRFLKSVGAGMAGDSQAAMTELVKRGEEN
jgi:hypothetical protein